MKKSWGKEFQVPIALPTHIWLQRSCISTSLVTEGTWTFTEHNWAAEMKCFLLSFSFFFFPSFPLFESFHGLTAEYRNLIWCKSRALFLNWKGYVKQPLVWSSHPANDNGEEEGEGKWTEEYGNDRHVHSSTYSQDQLCASSPVKWVRPRIPSTDRETENQGSEAPTKVQQHQRLARKCRSQVSNPGGAPQLKVWLVQHMASLEGKVLPGFNCHSLRSLLSFQLQ